MCLLLSVKYTTMQDLYIHLKLTYIIPLDFQ